MKKQSKKEVLTGKPSNTMIKYNLLCIALSKAEKKKKPSIESMFDDVYDKRTPDLERQYKDSVPKFRT